jgi:membrane protease YdiL (CAAX protease family)
MVGEDVQLMARSAVRHRSSLVPAGAVVAGGAALAARPLLGQVISNPDGALVVGFVVLLVVGAALPLPEPADRVATSQAVLPLVLGVGAFALARALGGGQGPAGSLPRLLVLNGLAAVAEEAFFRRLAYGVLLARSGNAGVALVGSAVLFALVHVTGYGFWVLPLDLAAGLLLGWQRQVTGGWAVPAVTHVLANALVLM